MSPVVAPRIFDFSAGTSFTKHSLKHCSGNTIGPAYSSLSAAEAACSANSKCSGVYDNRCCTDMPGFKDSYGTCKMYRDNKWCTMGTMGSAWKPSWGPVGVQAKQSCCACGKQAAPGAAAIQCSRPLCQLWGFVPPLGPYYRLRASFGPPYGYTPDIISDSSHQRMTEMGACAS